MSVAIIISTHGVAAKQLLMTAEMLIGEQKNIAYIDFVPGENVDTLTEKYKQKINELDISNGVLFLVDMWGGSPFNAACRLIKNQDKDKDKYDIDIITGVNIPMLVNTLLSRDDNPVFSKLVSAAIENGRNEIKALNIKEINNKKSPSASIRQNKVDTNSYLTHSTGQGHAHMFIALARIDDRLIHGQVATCWTKETKVKRIIVVSDEVAKDQIRSTLLKQVAPPGVFAHVINIAKCIRVYNNPKYAGERVMLLFTKPIDVLRVIEDGVQIKSVNIGGISYRAGKIQVNSAISIDNKDIEAFNKLSKLGIELEARKVASDNKLDMLALIKKAKI